jgi:hypothetical protein
VTAITMAAEIFALICVISCTNSCSLWARAA